MHVDLDDAGVGRDLDDAEARVEGRRVALEADGLAHVGGGRLDGGDQRGVVRAVGERRQEHAQVPVARLDRERRAHRRARRRGRAPSAAQLAALPRMAVRASMRAMLGEGIGRQHVRIVDEGDLGRPASGRRRPIGESPGIRNRCPRRNAQRSVTNRALAAGVPCTSSGRT